MTLEQIILYPLNHRMVTEQWYAMTLATLTEYRMRAAQAEPVKAKRAYIRKAKPFVSGGTPGRNSHFEGE